MSFTLWKPDSEGDGNLVFLFNSPGGNVQSTQIIDPDGNVIATGNNNGPSNDRGNTVRFDTPGRDFPDGSIVQITTDSGTFYTQIGDSSARNENLEFTQNLDSLNSEAFDTSSASPFGGTVVNTDGGNTTFIPEFVDLDSLEAANVNFDESLEFAQNLGNDNRNAFFGNLNSPVTQATALGLVDTDTQGIVNSAEVLAPFNRFQGNEDTATNIFRAGEIDQSNLERFDQFNQFNQGQLDSAVDASGLNFRGRANATLEKLDSLANGTFFDDLVETQLTNRAQAEGAELAAASGISPASGAGANIKSLLDVNRRAADAKEAIFNTPGILNNFQSVLQFDPLVAQPTQIPLNTSNVADRLPVQSNISAGNAQQQIGSAATDIQTIDAENAFGQSLATQQFNESAEFNSCLLYTSPSPRDS